jgi:starch phosphorylase
VTARLSRWRKKPARRTFLFGLTAAEVENSQAWYNPRWHYENEPETRGRSISSFGPLQPQRAGRLDPIRDVAHTRRSFPHLADLKSYSDAHGRLENLYRDPEAWTEG